MTHEKQLMAKAIHEQNHNRSNVSEIRCRRCRRLLMKGRVVQVEIKCPKCGYVQHFAELAATDH